MLEMSNLSTNGWVTPVGRLRITRCTFWMTSTSAMLRSVPQLNQTWMLVVPVRVVERICWTPATRVTACSSGYVTVRSIVSGFAPLYCAETTMTGTVILGNRSRGRRWRAITLSTTTAMQAMKTAIGFFVAPRVRNIALLRSPQPPSRGSRRRGGRGADLLSLADEIGAAEDDGVARRESPSDLDALTGGLPHVDVLLPDLLILNDPDIVLCAEGLHRGQRHDERLPCAGRQLHRRVHARPQHLLRVGDIDLHLERSRRRNHAARDPVDRAGEHPAGIRVDQDLDRIALADHRQVGRADVEDHVEVVEIGDRQNRRRRARGYVGAGVELPADHHAGKRRGDRGVLQLDARVLERGGLRRGLGLRRFHLRRRRGFLLARRVGLRHGLPDLRARRVQRGLRRDDLRLRVVEALLR